MSPSPRQLQLQQRPVRGAPRAASPMRSRRVEAQRIGRDDRLQQRADAGELGDAAVRSRLRVEIPERAVERVAGRARRHRALQFAPVEPGDDRCRCIALERLDDAVDALAVARIGHAFAAPAHVAVVDLGDDDLGGRSWLPREIAKGCAERPGIGA